MNINNIKYQSWIEFKRDLFIDLSVTKINNGDFIFRGHGDSNYKLESTFDRKFPNLIGKEITVESKKLLELFKKECDGRIKGFSEFKDDYILALARHHGLPTRLLDWSISPYIAAFFAFSSCQLNNSTDIAIYALDSIAPEIDQSTGFQVLDIEISDNNRQLYQQGKYTLLESHYKSIDEYISHLPHKKDPILHKIIIPTTEASTALIDLSLMGINHSNLMQNIDGYAMSAFVKYSLY